MPFQSQKALGQRSHCQDERLYNCKFAKADQLLNIQDGFHIGSQREYHYHLNNTIIRSNDLHRTKVMLIGL